MSKPASPTFTAFRYMTRFRCIGAECEATCCGGDWEISIDRGHYETTKKALSSTAEGRQEFDSKVQRVKGVTSGRKYALFVMQEGSQNCSFFGADRMCSLQQRFGEQVLSDTCAVYPRLASRSGSRHELTGMTSCPEVARQLLLEPDALDLVSVPAAQFERPTIKAKLDEHPQKPYVRYHDELRSLMLSLLSDETFPLHARLSFVAYFANRTIPFLHEGAAKLDEARLLAEVERIENPALQRDLFGHFAQLPVDDAVSARIVLALIDARARVGGFRQLLDRAIVGYSGPRCVETAAAGKTVLVSATELVEAYMAQKRAWSKFAPRIDRYFTNYAKNYWVREWYVRSPNLLVHTIQLLARIATLRFLLFGHPLLVSAANRPDAECERALDAAVVETVQKFSRAFEHSPAFAKHLQTQLAASNLVSLAHAACLASF